MKIRKLLGAFIAVVIAGVSVADDNHLSLDGDWRFADASEKAAGEWSTLPVPGSWNTFTEYADYVGDAWYEREATIPKNWKGKRVYLKFDAVYDIADVWLGNEYLGQHTGGYTPFEFDVTDLAKPGDTVTIKLKANNEHKLGAWFQWGGINRSVSMFARNDLRLLRQKIESVLDLETGTTQIKLFVTVENKSDSSRSVKVSADIAEVADVGFRMSERIAAGETVTLSSQITLSTTQTREWHFDDPQLYHLETVLAESGERKDSLKDRFGVRSIEFKQDGMYLNGEKVRLMGYNRVHDHRAYGNVEPRELVRADIDMMKRTGTNFARIMHAPSAPDLLDYCDEIGYLLWAEIPIWQTVYRVPMDSREDAFKAPQSFPGNAMREMMQRDWNHPSIVGWSPGNEMVRESSYYVEAMRPFVKELDPTRAYANIHYKGFSNFQKGGSEGIDARNVDGLFINGYGNSDKKIEKLLKQHEDVPQLPIFYSEYGESRSESLNHMVDFAPLWERLGKEPYVIGGAHWTLNDYRSYYEKTPASQNRDWGIVDIWRNPKTLYYHMMELNQPVHAINADIDSGKATVVIQPRSELEIPSFTLRGYSWVYELLDESGKTLSGGIYKLDDIAPGSPEISNTVDLNSEAAELLVVSLISKNGYTVTEARFDVESGERLKLPTFPEPLNPEVRKILPLDRSFMVGVTNLDGDTGLEVRYGEKEGQYTESLNAPVMGSIRVRDLDNGTLYFGQVRRIEADGPGPWSPEFQVMPDGGLAPKSPTVLGVVTGADSMAVRLEVGDKVWGYEATSEAGDVTRVEYANPGLLMLPLGSVSLRCFGEWGASESVSLQGN